MLASSEKDKLDELKRVQETREQELLAEVEAARREKAEAVE